MAVITEIPNGASQRATLGGNGTQTARAGARGIADADGQSIKTAVHKRLIERLDLEKLQESQTTRAGQQQLLHTVLQLIGEHEIPLSAAERDALAQEVLDELFGLGPLEPLLKDATISDILVNTASAGVCGTQGRCSRRPP